VEAPQAQSVSNLKGVFGFEKKLVEGALKGALPAKPATNDASWVKKDKLAEEVKPPVIAANSTSTVKPIVTAPPATSNPWKKADPPA
jgi:hypothetical protein